MAATKLRIYQDAARLLADARFALITDDVETRYVFDDAWDEAVTFVLRQAPWRFALKTVVLTPGGTALAGYSTSYAFPADHLRTHAIWLNSSDGRENPLDLREQGTAISVNYGAPTMRYVASGFADPSLAGNPWPEHFAQLVAAYLAFLAAHRVTGDASAPGRMSQLFSSLLPEAVLLDALPEDRWLGHQRSGAFFRAARAVLAAGFWRFAMAEAAPAADGTPAAGFANSFLQPTDLLHLHSLFTQIAGREFPFDVRQHGTHWSTNTTPIYCRYVSTVGHDSRLWPDSFMKAVGAFLAAEEAAGSPGYENAAATYQALLDAARVADAVPGNRWLLYQLDGSFLRGARSVMQRGYWAYLDNSGTMRGLKEVQLDRLTDQSASAPEYPFPYRYPMPADHFKTHALFVPWDGQECPINIRESAHEWSTDADNFVARYVGTEVLDAQTWPEIISRAVLAYLDWQSAAPDAAKMREAEFDRLLTEALAAHSRPEDEWLRFQLNGMFDQSRKQLLEQGRWRFAIKTVSLTESSDPLPAEEADGSVSDSYGYRFIKPNDLLRLVWIYYLQGSGTTADRFDIDYREEGGAWHANYTPITVRYISRLGLDATKWPANFRDAVLLWLKYSEARADPRMVAQARALLEMFEARAREVERLDDARDRAPRRGSRFVAARYGRGGIDRENAWPFP